MSQKLAPFVLFFVLFSHRDIIEYRTNFFPADKVFSVKKVMFELLRKKKGFFAVIWVTWSIF